MWFGWGLARAPRILTPTGDWSPSIIDPNPSSYSAIRNFIAPVYINQMLVVPIFRWNIVTLRLTFSLVALLNPITINLCLTYKPSHIRHNSQTPTWMSLREYKPSQISIQTLFLKAPTFLFLKGNNYRIPRTKEDTSRLQNERRLNSKDPRPRRRQRNPQHGMKRQHPGDFAPSRSSCSLAAGTSHLPPLPPAISHLADTFQDRLSDKTQGTGTSAL